MNTKRKVALIFELTFGLFALAAVVTLYLYSKGTIPSWTILIVIALPMCEMPFVFVIMRRYNLRYEEAKSRGRALCSRCEYEIPETQEKVACPECGVVRSAKEHREVLENWKWWKT